MKKKQEIRGKIYRRMIKSEVFMEKKEGLICRIKQNGKIYLYMVAMAVLFLLICSRSSLLYPCNNWDDANSYFSMGKFMMNGGVIYRDLYDQKGPYLYLLYGLAYLISGNTFFGVFLMEILAVSFFLLAGYRIFCLYCREKTALVLVPILAAACLSAKSLYWGGAAEEFCLPLFAWSLYFSLRYFKEEYPKAPGLKMILTNGIFAGIIMQVKFNMLGFYFAWMAAIALMNFTRANRKKALASCGVFLSGMGITFLPWLIYFGIHGALDDWYTCYIYNNVFLYSDLSKASTGIGGKIYTLAKILYYLILDNASYFIPLILGMFFLLVYRGTRWYEKLNLYAMFGLLFLGIFVGGANLPYYSIPLMVFATVGLGAVGVFLDWLLYERGGKNKETGTSTVKWTAAIVCVCLVCLTEAWTGSMNTPFMEQKKEEFFLYKFKEIVQQEEEPTLLNYNCLDAGLYTVAEIVPTCKYFQTNGIPLKEMEEEQRRYMREGKTEFVLTRDSYPENIREMYDLVGYEKNLSNGTEFEYYLFKRK